MISLKDVEKRTENVNMDEDPSGWRPYHIFVDTVREKYAKDEGLQGTHAFNFLNLSFAVVCPLQSCSHFMLCASLICELFFIVSLLVNGSGLQ